MSNLAHQHIGLPKGSIEKQTTTLNLGPTHPATHGVFQNIIELDGERIVSAEQTVGYIHRAFEKLAERRPLYQITTITDRLNYCSSPINNMGWHLTCEKLLHIKTPKRVDYLRVIIMELSRITDHLICNSIVGVDSGAYTGFLYVMQYRELAYEIYEEVCGSRLTTSFAIAGFFYFTPLIFSCSYSKYFIASHPQLCFATTFWIATISMCIYWLGKPNTIFKSEGFIC